MSSIRIRAVSVGVALLVSVGCADRDGEITSPPTGLFSTTSAETAAVESGLFEKFGDTELLEIAAEVPSYGGHFQEKDGTIVVWTTDTASSLPARRAIQARVANGRLFVAGNGSIPRVVVREAQFSVIDLARWRDVISRSGSGIKWSMLDLDEGRNQITIGVSSAEFAALSSGRLAQVLRGLEVPVTAIRLVPVEALAVRRRVLPTGNVPANQGAYADSLVGGLRYSWNDFGAWKGCTVGFTAVTSTGQNGFISASHCSQQKWDSDTTSIVQPRYGLGIPVIAQELWDMGPGTCPFFWSCNHYRFSDANFNRATSSTRSIKLGYLARPTSRNQNIGSDTAISSADPYIEVGGETSSIMQGSNIDQIGATSGWTYSTVDETCVTWDNAYWPFNGQALRCAYIVNADYKSGDSGGPVFYMSGGKAIAAGIIAANTINPVTGNHRGVFSKFMYVRSELQAGGFTFSILPNSTPPNYYPYYASISGASSVRPNASCHYMAMSNLSYTSAKWRVNGAIVGQNWDLYHSSSNSYSLELEVSDGVNVAFATKTITVSAEAGECYDQ